MSEHKKILDWVETQKEAMQKLAVQWSAINSHTANLKGLKKLSNELADAFSPFQEIVQLIDLPDYERINSKGEVEYQHIASALSIQKRRETPKQVLLVCHMDTVYPAEDSIRKFKHIDDQKILAPGITDAKGGIVVMLKALEAFEQSPLAKNVGWQVLINTDEEIGSPSSTHLLEKLAQSFNIGLVFEPCLPNGDLVGARKGSGNFTLVVRGKAAHAGRDFEKGHNAIDALSQCMLKISALTQSREGLTINVGVTQGGSSVNVVPDLALARYNVRYTKIEDQKYINEKITEIVKQTADECGVQINVHGKFSAPPKKLDEKTLSLLKHIQQCGKVINLDLNWQDSGGVCDGNRLQSAGLPTVDTLGVQGGDIHSDNEYLLVESLVKRAQLTTLCLLQWANDQWNI